MVLVSRVIGASAGNSEMPHAPAVVCTQLARLGQEWLGLVALLGLVVLHLGQGQRQLVFRQ